MRSALVASIVLGWPVSGIWPAAGAPPPAGPSPGDARAAERAAHRGVDLPRTAGGWTLAPGVETYDAETLFDWMDGAAELYVGYRFDRLDVHRYVNASPSPHGGPSAEAEPARGSPGREILVELYWMRSSDDAFGLISDDWRGEVVLAPAPESADSLSRGFPGRRALYRSGMLRIWSDELYARVIAADETPSSREAVLAIGEAIVAGRSCPPPPEILSALPPCIGGRRLRRDDGPSFLRSHLVLNARGFVTGENVLALDLSTGAVLATYAGEGTEGEPRRVLVVDYAAGDAGKGALRRLREACSETDGRVADATRSSDAALVGRLRDRWLAGRLDDRRLVLALDCPDAESARRLLSAVPSPPSPSD
jgi:hypothetical protein